MIAIEAAFDTSCIDVRFLLHRFGGSDAAVVMAGRIVQFGNYSFYYPELLSGTIYLRCFEVSKNEELSARRIKESTSVDFHGHNKFGKIVDMQRFTIYEGDWGEYYAVRVEVWYHDPVKKEERMLMSKIYRMEGWMR